MKDTRFNSYLIKNTIKKRTLFMLVFLTWIAFTVFTTNHMNKGNDWIEIGLTLSFFASFLILYPLTERWFYQPWQNKATKVEYTFLK